MCFEKCENKAQEFDKIQVADKNVNTLTVWLILPCVEKEKTYPLIVSLGGTEKGISGSHDPFVGQNCQKEHPCFIFEPQVANGKTYFYKEVKDAIICTVFSFFQSKYYLVLCIIVFLLP